MRIISALSGIATATAVAVLLAVFLSSSPSGSPVRRHVVEIRHLEYTPKELVVSPGDIVTWVNHDLVPHTVTAGDASWGSGLMARDQWQLVVHARTTPNYFCRYHPSMDARLRIVPR